MEKGSSSTAFERGSVAPKPQAKADKQSVVVENRGLRCDDTQGHALFFRVTSHESFCLSSMFLHLNESVEKEKEKLCPTRAMDVKNQAWTGHQTRWCEESESS